jgi:hypothetical protein
MRRKNRIVVSRPDLARVLAILDSHSKWPHRRIHHLELRKALEQAQIVAAEEVAVDVVTLDSDVRVRNSKTGIARDYTLVSYRYWARWVRHCSGIAKVTKSSRRCLAEFSGCRSRK